MVDRGFLAAQLPCRGELVVQIVHSALPSGGEVESVALAIEAQAELLR